MTTKAMYVNDLLHRKSGYSFTESLTGSIYTVTFKDGSSVTQAEQTGMSLIDAYRKLRLDVLDGETPVFQSTTTQRDALSVHAGTHIHNITTDTNQMYTGVAWV